MFCHTLAKNTHATLHLHKMIVYWVLQVKGTKTYQINITIMQGKDTATQYGRYGTRYVN